VLKSEKRYNELRSWLSADDPHKLAEAVKMLRETEPFEGALGLLAQLYDRAEDRQLRKVIENFFNDMKEADLRKELIDEALKPRSQETISMLVASCWQSGLDYSEYAEDFVKIFLTGSYETAIEAMTVLEEFSQVISRQEKDVLIKKIIDSPLSGVNEKSTLTLELILLLEK
jgi:hypothetical protein